MHHTNSTNVHTGCSWLFRDSSTVQCLPCRKSAKLWMASRYRLRYYPPPRKLFCVINCARSSLRSLDHEELYKALLATSRWCAWGHKMRCQQPDWHGTQLESSWAEPGDCFWEKWVCWSLLFTAAGIWLHPQTCHQGVICFMKVFLEESYSKADGNGDGKSRTAGKADFPGPVLLFLNHVAGANRRNYSYLEINSWTMTAPN